MERDRTRSKNGYPQSILGYNDLTVTAFGQQKVSLDKSLLHMLWTYDVSRRGNKEMLFDGTDYIEQPTFTNATSYEGGLRLTSGETSNQRTQLRTLQHTRYQPNKGYLYSASIMLPDPSARGIRRWGAFIPCNGVWLEIEGDGADYQIHLVVRNHWKDDKRNITSFIPKNTDVSKGNLWDIQMEWRGVGDYYVYFNLELIYKLEYIGKLDKVSLENPSLPASFECINKGDEVIIRSGCVDISAEGGDTDKRFYGSISTGTSLINVTNTQEKGTAVLAMRLPKKINYGELVNPETGDPDPEGTNGVCYSRDTVLDAITTFCKDESFTIVNASRGVYLPNVSTLTGWQVSSDSYVEYLIGGVGSNLETAFQLDKANMRVLHSSRHELDQSAVIPNPNPETTPFFVTSDSYLLVSIKPEGANKYAGCNIEFSEQI